MSVSQLSTGLSIDLSTFSREAAEALQTFAAFLGKGGEAAEAFQSFAAFLGEGAEREGPEAFADFEIGLHERLMGLGRAVIGKHVEDRDENVGPVHGRVFYRSTEATSKTIHTLFGPVKFLRPLYRSPGSPSFSPVDESLGLFDKYLTDPAAHGALMLLCHCTPADGAKILKQLGGMNPSLSCLQRLLTRAGERWNEKESTARDAIREAETVPEEAASCTVSLDGVMVPLRPDGDREACWREASCGTVSFHDADGNRLRTVSLARMPEAGKATLKEQLAAEVAHVRKARPDLPLVAVADAAPDNWTFLEELQPDERAIDFFHACEHLAEVADHAVATDWYDRYRAVLRDDEKGVDKVVRAISAAGRQDRRSRFLTASSHSSARTGAACTTPASRPRATRSGRASWRPPTRCWSTSA